MILRLYLCLALAVLGPVARALNRTDANPQLTECDLREDLVQAWRQHHADVEALTSLVVQLEHATIREERVALALEVQKKVILLRLLLLQSLTDIFGERSAIVVTVDPGDSYDMLASPPTGYSFRVLRSWVETSGIWPFLQKHNEHSEFIGRVGRNAHGETVACLGPDCDLNHESFCY